jgi:RHS repeat-associated protein
MRLKILLLLLALDFSLNTNALTGGWGPRWPDRSRGGAGGTPITVTTNDTDDSAEDPKMVSVVLELSWDPTQYATDAYLGYIFYPYGASESLDNGNDKVVEEVRLMPDKKYTFVCQSNYVVDYLLRASPQPGYVLTINEYPYYTNASNAVNAYSGTTPGSSTPVYYELKLVEAAGFASANVGGVSFVDDQLRVSYPLGNLVTGESAGAVVNIDDLEGSVYDLFDREYLQATTALDSIHYEYDNGVLEHVKSHEYGVVIQNYEDNDKHGYTVSYLMRNAPYINPLSYGVDFFFRYRFYYSENDTPLIAYMKTERYNGSGWDEVSSKEYTYSGNHGWNLSMEGGERDIIISAISPIAGSDRTVRLETKKETVVGNKIERAYINAANNTEKLFKEIEYTGTTQWVTEYDYYSGASDEINGLTKSIKYPDGNWKIYSYYDFGDDVSSPLVKTITEPWLDQAFSNAGTTSGGSASKITKYEYTTGRDGEINYLISSRLTGIGSSATFDNIANVISKTEYTYAFKHNGNDIKRNQGSGELKVMLSTAKSFYINESSELVGLDTISGVYDEDYTSILNGMPVFELNSTGEVTLYEYDEVVVDLVDGRYDAEGSIVDEEYPGFVTTIIKGSVSGSGTSYSMGFVDGPGGVPSGYPHEIKLISNKSTKSRIIRDMRGYVVREESYVYVSSAWSLVSWKDSVYTDDGRLLTVYKNDFSDGSNDLKVKEIEYDSEGRIYAVVNVDGSRVEYSDYDELDQVVEKIAYGSSFVLSEVSPSQGVAIPNVITSYTYDPAGRVTETKTGVSGEYIKSSKGFYESGALKYEENEFGVRMSYEYDVVSGNKEVTSWRVDAGGAYVTGSETVKTYHGNGRLKSSEGCGSCGGIDTFYSYSTGSYSQTTLTRIGENTNGYRFKEVTVDGLGRTKTEVTSAFDYDGDAVVGDEVFVRTYSYDPTSGLLSKLEESGVADQLFEYDEFGLLVREGLDVNDNGTLVDNSIDRITEFFREYTYADSSWWYLEQVDTPIIASDGTPVGTSKTVSQSYTRLTGMADNTLAESYAVDGFGNKTWRRTSVNQGSKKLKSEVDLPDVGAVQSTASTPQHDAYSIQVAGRSVLTMGADGAYSLVKEYDAQGRVEETYDSQLGYSMVEYAAYKNGNPSSDYVTSMPIHYYKPQSTSYTSSPPPGNINRKLTYDNLGRPILEEVLESGSNYLTTRRSYDAYDRVTKVWGSRPSPVEYVYDSIYGHMSAQKTYRGGSDWDNPSWPASPDAPDITTFDVDKASGLLFERIDGESTGNTLSYHYDVRGNMLYFTNGRGEEIAYSYDPATSELLTINYGNDPFTTEVTYAYNRLGGLNSVVEYGIGTRTFTYSTEWGYPVLKQEALPAFFDTAADVTRNLVYSRYDSEYLSAGRSVGKPWSTALKDGSTTKLSANYDYDVMGRLDYISYYANGHSNVTVDYDFNSNSSLPKETLIKRSGTNRVWNEKTWEANRYLLQQTKTNLGSSSGPVIAQHYYKHNELGQRIAEYKRGQVYSHYTGGGIYGIVRDYEYNERGELTSAIDKLDPNSSIGVGSYSTAVVGRQWGYNLDNQGNRTTDGKTYYGSRADDYTPNSYNEYSSIRRDTERYISGANHPSASSLRTRDVVNGSAGSWATPSIQNNYYWDAFTESISSGSWQMISLESEGYYSFAWHDLVTTEKVMTDEVETPLYDEDGNLEEDDRWHYNYDEANRLTSMVSKGAFYNGQTEFMLVRFTYDYLGRRVQKIVFTTPDWETTTSLVAERYIYDGWNVIAVIDTSGNYLKRQGWGRDVSGSIHGTGGVGGLVVTFDDENPGSYSPVYDGNGNVVAMVDLVTGGVDAKYEYTPFGEITRAEGDYAAANPYRFSTKWLDDETDFYYYGHRYYDARNGRFINRDPIGEAGGINLYQAFGGDPVNKYDILGLNTPEYNYCISQALSQCLQESNDGNDTGRFYSCMDFEIWACQDVLYSSASDQNDQDGFYELSPFYVFASNDEVNQAIYENDLRFIIHDWFNREYTSIDFDYFNHSSPYDFNVPQQKELGEVDCLALKHQISSITNILTSVEGRIVEANPSFAAPLGFYDSIVDFARSNSTNASAGGAFVESTLQHFGAGNSRYWDITPGSRLSEVIERNATGRVIDGAGKVIGAGTAGLDILAGVDSLAQGDYAEAGYRGVSAGGGIASLWLAPGPGWAIAGGAFIIDQVKSNRENHWKRWAAEHTRQSWTETLLRDLDTRGTHAPRLSELRSQWDEGNCARFE